MSLKLLKHSMEIIENESKDVNNKKKNKKPPTDRMHGSQICKNPPAKINLDNIKKQAQCSDQTLERNLKSLLALSHNTIKIDKFKKIVEKIQKKPVNVVRPSSQEESIFTEEDFAAFEREYVP